jgi:hypothetical protein
MVGESTLIHFHQWQSPDSGQKIRQLVTKDTTLG